MTLPFTPWTQDFDQYFDQPLTYLNFQDSSYLFLLTLLGPEWTPSQIIGCGSCRRATKSEFNANGFLSYDLSLWKTHWLNVLHVACRLEICSMCALWAHQQAADCRLSISLTPPTPLILRLLLQNTDGSCSKIQKVRFGF